MNLDAYMNDFGRELARADGKRRSRRRLTLALLPAVPAGAALALAVTVLPGGGDVDAVAAARDALAPAGQIVHMKVELRSSGTVVFPMEQWYATNPDRLRTRTQGPVVEGGSTTVETLTQGGRVRFYDARRDVVTIWRDGARARRGGPSLLGGDPAGDLRDQLGAGVRDAGVTTVDGRDVRRLVREDLNRRLLFYVDPDTFEPVGGELNLERPDGTLSRGPTFRVTLYERLPLDDRSAGLLKLGRTPNTRFVWR